MILAALVLGLIVGYYARRMYLLADQGVAYLREIVRKRQSPGVIQPTKNPTPVQSGTGPVRPKSPIELEVEKARQTREELGI